MEVIVSILIILGSAFILISALGLIRFDTLLNRMHATTKATSFGLFILLIAVAVFFNDWVSYLKAILTIIFIYITAPLAAHAVSKSNTNKPF